MRIQLQRINSKQHTLTIRYPDGNVFEETLETKSFLIHDFVHFALEETAGLKNSFWGKLAQQKNPNRENQMGRDNFKPETEIEYTEVLTGPLMGLTRNPNTISETISSIQEIFKSYNVETPQYMNEEFLNAFLKRFNELRGTWNSTNFGDNFELVWNK